MVRNRSGEKNANREFMLQTMVEALELWPKFLAGPFMKLTSSNVDGSLSTQESRKTFTDGSKLNFEHRVWSQTDSEIAEYILTESIRVSRRLLHGFLSQQWQRLVSAEGFNWNSLQEPRSTLADARLIKDGSRYSFKSMTVSFSRSELNTRTGSKKFVRVFGILSHTPRRVRWLSNGVSQEVENPGENVRQ